MRTINIYTFDELSDEAKAKAIQNAREKEKYWDMECPTSEAVDSIKAAADIFGYSRLINWSIGSDVYRSFVTLPTNNILENEDIKGERLRTWLINHRHWVFYEMKPQGKYRTIGETKKWEYPRRSRIQFVETCCPFTGVCYDDIFLDTFRKFIKRPWDCTLEELFVEAVHTVCKALESEEEYQQSDEGIIDFLACNEHDFTEEGEFI